MKHKVAELDGIELDLAVAKAAGMSHLEAAGANYDWQVAGPIIERERISVWLVETEFRAPCWSAGIDVRTDMGPNIEADHQQDGPTPLIAAMRAYVASKFGDEVELP